MLSLITSLSLYLLQSIFYSKHVGVLNCKINTVTVTVKLIQRYVKRIENIGPSNWT